MLFKTVAIILSTLFIAAVQMSTANAGCGSHGAGAKSSLYKKQAAKQSRARRATQIRAAGEQRQRRKAQQQAHARKAVAETPAEVAKTAATVDDTQTVATAGDTCTRFIAATGTTVSVPCSTE